MIRMSETHRTPVRLSEIALNWSGLVALVGVVAAFATMQAEMKATQQRQLEIAQQVAQMRETQAAAGEKLATKTDIDAVTRRLDGLYTLILQQEGARRVR